MLSLTAARAAAHGSTLTNRGQWGPCAAPLRRSTALAAEASPKPKKKRAGRKKKKAEPEPVPEAEAAYKYVPPENETFPVAYGNFTPASFITYSDDPEDQLCHELSIDIDASAEAIWPYLYEWENVPKVFDLIDTIGLPPADSDNPEHVLIQMFYRWGELPMMQIISAAIRLVAEENEEILVQATDGMPFRVQAKLEALDGGGTRVNLKVEHVMPRLMVDWVGHVGFGGHVKDILQENLDMLKRMAEGTITEEEREAHYLAMRPPLTPPDESELMHLEKVDVDSKAKNFGERKSSIVEGKED